MSEETKPSGTSLVLAFLAGAVAGAVVALLATPKTGRELRGTIKDFARDGKAREAAARAAGAARRAFDDIVSRGGGKDA